MSLFSFWTWWNRQKWHHWLKHTHVTVFTVPTPAGTPTLLEDGQRNRGNQFKQSLDGWEVVRLTGKDMHHLKQQNVASDGGLRCETAECLNGHRSDQITVKPISHSAGSCLTALLSPTQLNPVFTLYVCTRQPFSYCSSETSWAASTAQL